MLDVYEYLYEYYTFTGHHKFVVLIDIINVGHADFQYGSDMNDTEYDDVYIVDQIDAKILIMCLYLSLSALHVSDFLVHHQERRFGAAYRNWY